MLSHQWMRGVILPAVLALAALANSSISRAQTAESGSWRQIKVETAPSPRYDHVLVIADDKVVLFGGRAEQALSDTWIFEPAKTAWREIKTDVAPAARFSMGAAYDEARKRVLIFAGQQSGVFNDVWAFDLEKEAWSQIETKGTPPVARYGTSAVVDPVNDTLIISHGFAAGRFDDTFMLDLKTNTWQDVSPETRPLKRCLHEAIFVGGKMLLYGGCSSGVGPCPQGDLWSFDPATKQWTELKAAGGIPPARSNPSLAVDAKGLLWLFGGRGAQGEYLADLWSFDAEKVVWTQHKSDSAPEGRSSHDAIWDKANKQMLMFGGRGTKGFFNELWTYLP